MTRELLLAALAALVSAWTWFSHRDQWQPPPEAVLPSLPLEIPGADGEVGFRVFEEGETTILELVRGEASTRIEVATDGTVSLLLGDSLEAEVTDEHTRLEIRSSGGRVVHEASEEGVSLVLDVEGGDALALSLSSGREGLVQVRQGDTWTTTPIDQLPSYP